MFDTKENLAKNARNNAEIHIRHKFIYTVELENRINLCMYLPHLFAMGGYSGGGAIISVKTIDRRTYYYGGGISGNTVNILLLTT